MSSMMLKIRITSPQKSANSASRTSEKKIAAAPATKPTGSLGLSAKQDQKR